MASDSRFVSFQGMSVHFCIDTPATPLKRRVLLLSSPFCDVGCWRSLVKRMTTDGCLCVTVDLPGFGESMTGTGVPHHPETRAKIIWGVLDQVDLSDGGELREWHLIGHGSAAGTVMTMAYLQPESVRSLVLISPILAPRPNEGMAFLWKTRLGKQWIRHLYRRNVGHAKHFSARIRSAFGASQPSSTVRRLRRALLRPGTCDTLEHMLVDGYTVSPEVFLGFHYVMIVWGGKDPLLGGRIPQSVRKRLPNAEMHVIQTGAHYVMSTHAKVVNDFLRGWMHYVETPEQAEKR